MNAIKSTVRMGILGIKYLGVMPNYITPKKVIFIVICLSSVENLYENKTNILKVILCDLRERKTVSPVSGAFMLTHRS